MELIQGLFLLLLIIHLFGLLYNKGKFLTKMVKFMKVFKKQELIGQTDYNNYVQRFDGLFNFFEPIPSSSEFINVNGNTEFESFLERARSRNTYFLIGSGVLFLMTLILDLF